MFGARMRQVCLDHTAFVADLRSSLFPQWTENLVFWQRCCVTPANVRRMYHSHRGRANPLGMKDCGRLSPTEDTTDLCFIIFW